MGGYLKISTKAPGRKRRGGANLHRLHDKEMQTSEGVEMRGREGAKKRMRKGGKAKSLDEQSRQSVRAHRHENVLEYSCKG